MNKKKKTIIIISILAAILIIGGVIYYLVPHPIHLSVGKGARVLFNPDGEKIDVMISEDMTADLVDVIDGKKLAFDSGEPECGFDETVAIVVDGKRFLVARDGCPTLKYHNRYVELSEEEMKTVHRVMEDFGAYFPCV